MNAPTPAIVTQDAVRRLPRPALLLLCVVYVLSGFIGRMPWASADVAGFGYMMALAKGSSPWLDPQLMGQAPEVQALLPYWLGAWFIQAAPTWLAPDLAARIPFIGLLALTLTATWYAVFFLARSAQAQPVSFAFGGEARPSDYARAVADGALLALIACLGLAQLAHETTPAVAQLAFSATCFLGLAALPARGWLGRGALVVGLFGLGLSGSPAMAGLFALGAIVIEWRNRAEGHADRAASIAWIAGVTALASLLQWHLDLWHWRIKLPALTWQEIRSVGRFWLWFGWPAWPLAMWTLWRWRLRLWNRHLALPLWLSLVGYAASITSGGDRALLLALPALATLAAFALPTLSRSLSALIDWFTLLFFSTVALLAWGIWIAVLTGVPRQPAANVARLYPGFVMEPSPLLFSIALTATLAWLWLVRWRTGRHRAAIWKSLVLPAGGMALAWLLLTTLGLPLMNFRLSYAPLVQRVASLVTPGTCVQAYGLTRAQASAFQYHGQLDLRSADRSSACEWLLVQAHAQADLGATVDMTQWQLMHTIQRPADTKENVLLYRRREGP